MYPSTYVFLAGGLFGLASVFLCVRGNRRGYFSPAGLALAITSALLWIVAVSATHAFGKQVVVSVTAIRIEPGDPTPWFVDPEGNKQLLFFPTVGLVGKEIEAIGVRRLFFGYVDGPVRYRYRVGGLTAEFIPLAK